MIYLIAFLFFFDFRLGPINGSLVAFILVLLCLMRSGLSFKLYRDRILLFLAIIISQLISVSVFFSKYTFFEARNIIQFLASLFIFIFCIKFTISKDWDKVIVKVGGLYTAYFFIVYIINISNHKTWDLPEMWGASYFSGWPNSSFLPFLFLLILSFRNTKRVVSVIFSIPIIIIGSRLGIGVCILVFLVYFKRYIKILLIPLFFIIFIILMNGFAGDITRYNIFDSSSIFFFVDRIAVFKSFYSYFVIEPFFGFGGNTLDQIPLFLTDTRVLMKWSHTHNFILEQILRYGFISGIIYLIYFINIVIKMQVKNNKYFLLILYLSALFQTYFKEPFFLFIMFYLTCCSEKDCDYGN